MPVLQSQSNRLPYPLHNLQLSLRLPYWSQNYTNALPDVILFSESNDVVIE